MELKEKHLSIAESNNPVSEKMLDLISKKGLKQTYIAEKAGYSPQALSDMVRGRRLIRACDILKIADALNIATDELFGRAGDGKVMINGREIEEIQILTSENELIASITCADIIERDGYKVVCVPAND